MVKKRGNKTKKVQKKAVKKQAKIKKQTCKRKPCSSERHASGKGKESKVAKLKRLAQIRADNGLKSVKKSRGFFGWFKK